MLDRSASRSADELAGRLVRDASAAPAIERREGDRAIGEQRDQLAKLQRAVGNRAFGQLISRSGLGPVARPSEKRPSAALALRSALRQTQPTPVLARRSATRLLARDIKGDEKVTEGTFKMNLKTESHAGAKSGLSGTIAFHPSDTAPDSTLIKLFQAVKLVDSATGKDYVWTGADAARTAMQTKADPNRSIGAGWWIDIVTSKVKPRTKLADPAITPYYRDTQPNVGYSQDGSKQGKTITDASLWDYPGSGSNMVFAFETVAKATDTGHVYGSVMWGFAISDAAKGTVSGEYASGRDVTLATTDQALTNLDEYYKNPGSTNAPTK
jgi:hypothetical protein